MHRFWNWRDTFFRNFSHATFTRSIIIPFNFDAFFIIGAIYIIRKRSSLKQFLESNSPRNITPFLYSFNECSSGIHGPRASIKCLQKHALNIHNELYRTKK